MNLMRCLRRSPCPLRAIRLWQELRQRNAWYLPLQPHAEFGNQPERFRDRNAILAFWAEAGTAEALQQVVGLFVQSFGARFAQNNQDLVRFACAPQPQFVFDEAPPARLVAGHFDRAKRDFSLPAVESRAAR